MPWTTKDVDKHKKGLSDKEKARWVATANSVLADCMKNGGTDETCAAKAIKIANGTVKVAEAMFFYINTEKDYKVARRKFEGRDFMIVPVTMMVEGVHNGNHGPIFHSIKELGKIPETWNGIPIVINHPVDRDGIAVSANSPEILEEASVGKVFGTFVDDTKLKAKAWLDELKLQEVSVDLYNKINEGEPIEVSVGVFSEDEDEEGEWNGETYSKVAINHRPDHLALLPDAVGACSLADGCGLCVNQTRDNLEIMMRAIRCSGFSVSEINIHKKAGYKERMDAVYSGLRGLDKENMYHYLEEMYDDSLIYSKSSKDGTKMYKQDYKFESGKIEFTGNPVEVHRKVEYVLISNNQNKEVNMANDCTPCIKKKVDELIANSQGRWTEGDREFLQALDEAKLDKLAPQIIEKEKVVEKEVQVNVLSKEDQDALAAYKAEQKAKREQTIKDIQANSSKELWPDDVLKGMDDSTLKRVFDSVKKEEVADYSLNGGAVIQTNAGEIEPLLPAGVEIETKK